jgi:ArsR family transcriptional regulator, arsenate/arsenite/antimonite-responsive transcriptional repressor
MVIEGSRCIHIEEVRYSQGVKSLPVIQCCAPIASDLTDAEAEGLEGLFGALADRNRVKILNMLMKQGCDAVCVCDLEPALGLSQPTVSYHLKKLVDAGLLEREKRGTYAYYSLRDGTRRRLRSVFA